MSTNGTQAATLLTKYRPDKFELCLGNEVAIKALAEAVRSPARPHCYLFTGSSGIGKTTLARIIAKEVNASIQEFDVSVNGSVDDMRQLSEMCGFKPITVEPNKLYIIDECHNLGPPSAKAWQPLLKLTEDCTSYNYFAFCTTEPHKVPETLKTRSYCVALKPLLSPDIEELISFVAEAEGWQIENSVFGAIIQAAKGSARRALSILQAGHACTSKDQLAEVILEVDAENNPVGKLCQFLVKGGRNWKTVSQYLDKLEDVEDPVAHATSYIAKVIVRSEEEQARELARMLHAFNHFNTYDKRVDFISGVTWFLYGNIIF